MLVVSSKGDKCKRIPADKSWTVLYRTWGFWIRICRFSTPKKNVRKNNLIYIPTINYRVATSYIIFSDSPIVVPIQRQIRQLGVPIRPDPYPQLCLYAVNPPCSLSGASFRWSETRLPLSHRYHSMTKRARQHLSKN